MSVGAWAIRLLATLSDLLPPTEPCKHNLTVKDGRLVIHISQKSGWQVATLEPGDLDKVPEDLAKEIHELVSRTVGGGK